MPSHPRACSGVLGRAAARTRHPARLLRRPLSLVAVTVVSTLALGLLAPGAAADSLTERRAEVKQQLARTRGELNESSRALSAAGVAVDRAQDRLQVARAALAATRTELAAAAAKDRRMATKLVAAKAALAAAKQAVAKAQRRLDAEVDLAGAMVRDQYQQQTNLLPLAVLMQDDTTADLQTRLQWSTTMFDTSAGTIDRLTVLKARLAAEKARQAELTAQVAKDRQDAAANLELKRSLELRAERQERSVTALVQQRQAIEAAAAADVAADKKQYAKLAQERASVEHRIAARVARAKAAAARKAARQRAAAQAASAAAARAKKSASKPVHRSAPVPPTPSTSSGSYGGSSSSSGAHHGFIYPVSAPITSPYGMRFHPVLHYWKLHDGTDFGAGCGTPIHAAYSGRVAERYYNAGYGNRLMIDHGMVDGRYVTTGYNHAIRYVVSVGQHVRQGQVIGYVGTTGFSTGCHLHLMVWINGSVVNPMTWY